MENFAPFKLKMEQAGLTALEIEAFRQHYDRLVAGESGLISQQQLDPDFSVPDLEQTPDYRAQGQTALPRCLMIKLNGGLGTSMGLAHAKSLLPVKPEHNLTFLDVIATHVLHLRHTYNVPFPLLLMNSFRTDTDTLTFLQKYPQLPVAGLPLSFVQSQVPKVIQRDLSPATWPADPSPRMVSARSW